MRPASALFPIFVLASALGIVAEPAKACVSGPLPLNFVGKTATIDDYGKFLLKNYGRERPADTLQVIFYKSAVPANLALQRETTVRAYLIAIGRRNISVVQSQKPLPTSLAREFGYKPSATAEAVKGCF